MAEKFDNSRKEKEKCFGETKAKVGVDVLGPGPSISITEWVPRVLIYQSWDKRYIA